MIKFALRKNDYSEDENVLYNLVIDGVDQFELFEESIQKAQQSNFNTIASSIMLYSSNERLAHNKRKNIDSQLRLWEFKAGKLRVYHFKIKGTGTTICWAGTKNSQKKDIPKAKRLIREITDQIKKHGNIQIEEDEEESQEERSLSE